MMLQDVVVLAGGRGERLGGRVKPLLRHPEGGTLLARTLAEFSEQEAWVVAPSSFHALLREGLPDSAARARPVHFVADPGQGPGPAIVEAARCSTAETLLIVGGDHPWPSRSLADRLSELAPAGQGAWVINQEGYPEPMYAVVDRAGLLQLGAWERPPSATKLLGALRMMQLPVERLSEAERRSLSDVDRPEEAVEQGVNPTSAPSLSAGKLADEDRRRS